MVILFFYGNNINGVIIIDVYSLWNIGRFMIEKKDNCVNVHNLCSNFLSYYYGNSHTYSLFHIQMMEKFYSYFPIFLDSMKKICWKSYLELLKLNPKECYFYYGILLFCGDNYQEIKNLIDSCLYSRI